MVDLTSTYPSNNYFDLVDNSLHIEYSQSLIHRVYASVAYVSDPTINYYIDVFENGIYQTTVTAMGLGTNLIAEYLDTPGLDKKITLNVSSDFPMTIRVNMQYDNIPQQSFFADGTNQALIGTVDLSAAMPDMKIADFITGILKKFNLTCYGLTPYAFQVEPLEDWYKKGRILNITPYTDIDSVDIERIKIYKEISFAHEVSQSVTNVEFYDTFGRQYGDLQQSYNYESSEYQVKVPFENLLFNKFTGTNLQVGYYLDKSLVPYIPKPVLMYIEEAKTCSFKFNNGSTVDTLTSYRPFGQDLTYNNFKWSLNFGADISTLYNVVNPNSIYSVYYSGYLNNLYARKNRMYTYKTKLPISILTSLKLNDRLIIRDKRYIINEMKSELTSGDVTFVLILDFRAMNAITTSPVPKPSGTITVPILIGNQVTKITIDVGTTGVTASKSIITTDEEVVFTYPENTTSFYTIGTEDGDALVTEQLIKLRSEEGSVKVYDILLTSEFENGLREVTHLYIIQE